VPSKRIFHSSLFPPNLQEGLFIKADGPVFEEGVDEAGIAQVFLGDKAAGHGERTVTDTLFLDKFLSI
jgi:hypothetical protein